MKAIKAFIFKPVFLFLLTSGGSVLLALKYCNLVNWPWFLVSMPCGVCFVLLWVEHISMRVILKRSLKEV